MSPRGVVARWAALVLLGWVTTARADAVDAAPGVSAAAPAPDEDRARELFFQALESIRAERWAEAESALQQSQQIVKRPSTLYNLALSAFKQGRLLEGLELATALLEGDAGEPDPRYRDFGQKLVERVLADLPRVELSVRPAGATVTVDDREMADRGERRTLRVDPGRHRLTIAAEGYEPESTVLVLAPADRRSLEIALRSSWAAAAAPPKASPPAVVNPPRDAPAARGDTSGSGAGAWPWIVAGTGGAMLAGGAVTGVLALEADADFVAGCPELVDCDPSLTSLQHRVDTLGTVTDVLLVGGGVLVAGGVLWWLLDAPMTSAGARATAAVAPGGGAVAVTGRF